MPGRLDGCGFQYHPARLARPGELAPALVCPCVPTLPRRSPLLAPALLLRSPARRGSLASTDALLVSAGLSRRALGCWAAASHACGQVYLVHARALQTPRSATTPLASLGASSWLRPSCRRSPASRLPTAHALRASEVCAAFLAATCERVSRCVGLSNTLGRTVSSSTAVVRLFQAV